MHEGLDNRLSTGDDGGSYDLMDPPDLFGDLYPEDDDGEVAEVTTRPQGRRTPPAAALPAPRIKDASVKLPRSPEMAAALALADARGDLVTSGAEGYSGDGVHAPTSQHYKETAIDLRFARDVAAQAQAYRDAGYVAIVEKDHVHVQRYPVG